MVSEKLSNPSVPLVIAIDGTAGSGKGTIAKTLAQRFNLSHCETSILYRTLALKVLKVSSGMEDKRISEKEIIELSSQDLDFKSYPELYTPEVTQMASIVAAIPEVRKNLDKPQMEFLKKYPRVVIEGRDITTVIAPNADLKLFITADINVRAKRRFDQMKGSVSLEEITQKLIERDARDSSRISSPLKKSANAIEIDTSYNSPDEIIDQIIALL